MRLLDSRRLTGPNLLTRAPAAVAEVGLDPGEEPGRAVELWRGELGRMLAALGRRPPELAVRTFRGGAALAFPGPIDELLPLTEVNDWAAESVTALLAGGAPAQLEPKRTAIAAALEAAHHPPLLAIQREAARRGLPFLWDDQTASAGAGRRCRTWPLGELPPVAEIPWDDLDSIPVAMITGTNGKTTSSRLLARLVRKAGRVPGCAHTDGVAIDERTVEEGDWTGPAAARRVLRSPEVEVAVLETARGGILRRGLAVASCDAALITNVSADHLGDYGVDDLPAMARAKAVIGYAVLPSGRVVLNADDPNLVALAGTFAAPVVFFARDPASPALVAHRARGGEAVTVRDGTIVLARGAAESGLVQVNELPLAFGGAATYNVENALGVVGVASALQLPVAAVAAGLRSFGSGPDENPGRGNFFDVGGVRLLADFGHNPAAVERVLELVGRLRAGRGRLFVITGAAGDRSDEDIRTVARVIHGAGPHRVLLRELEDYLRGREPGAVPALFRDELTRLGMDPAAVTVAPDELGAARRAFDEARPGDFVLLLVHLEPDGIRDLVAERGGRPVAA